MTLQLPPQIQSSPNNERLRPKLQVATAESAGRGVSDGPHGVLGQLCDNCGNAGYIYLRTLESGPFDAPGQARSVVHYVDQREADQSNGSLGVGWYTCTTQAYPCPSCKRVVMLDFTMERTGLEREAWDYRLRDDFLPVEGKEQARKVALQALGEVPEPHGWITFHGGYGVGKTHLLQCMVADFARAGVSARYMVAADFIASLTQTWGQRDPDPTQTAEALIDKAAQYRVLALDEVDKVPEGSWHQATLFRFLDRRYREGIEGGRHLTLLALNTDPETAPDVGAGALFGYIKSRMSAGLVVPVGGDDLRPLQGEGMAERLDGGQ